MIPINYIKRFFRRLKNTLKFIPIQICNNCKWEFETCERCGRPYHVMWWTSNELWRKYSGHPDGGGDLCVDCFIELCSKHGKRLSQQDIQMKPFQPDIKNIKKNIMEKKNND